MRTARISRSQFGGVFKCVDQSGAVVAVKTTQIASTRPSSSHENVWRERYVASQLAKRPHPHPHVVQYKDQYVANGVLHVVMEFCGDGDLFHRLKQCDGHRMPEQEALAWIAQVADAVAFVHGELGIAHRDLSLENVLVQGDVGKLCDFGLSTDADKLATGQVGKRNYMAPEVVAAASVKGYYDPRAADVWSLGVMLFVLITGSPLFAVAGDQDPTFRAFQAHGLRALLDASEITPWLTPPAMDLLAWMLESDASRRPTIAQVQAHAALGRRTAS